MKYRPTREMIGPQLERWRVVRRIAAVSYLLFNTIYIVYRFTIINPHSLVLSWAYFIAEVFQFILGITYIFTSWSFKRRTPLPALKNRSIEVWVPVYREPIDVIKRTIYAAREIDHPHVTKVFDDGKREDVKALARELNIEYYSRPDNTDAKAGNLNFALARSKAELIMVFDADHIALPSAIDDLLGYFTDETVGLVQSPQDYYNTDAFQYFNAHREGGTWHDQSFFYLFGLPSMDHDDSASCVGTGVIYRRSALEEIGGIPTDTATEDIHTSLKLMKAGWKTVFHNDPVAYGIAAANLEEYYKTRHRWAHGNLHALSLENIPFTKGLTWKQRLHQLSLGLIYLEGWQQLLLLLIPVVALVTGWQPFVITPLNVLIVLLYPLISIALLQELGSGYSRIWANEIFSMARWPVHIISILGIFRRKILWKTSSKILQTQTTISRILPQLCILLLSATGLAVAIEKLIAHFESGVLLSGRIQDITKPLDQGYTADILIVAGGWAVYNIIRVIVFLKRARHLSDTSDEQYRFMLSLPICIHRPKNEKWTTTHWISETSVTFLSNEAIDTNTSMRFTLPLPTGTITADLHVKQCHEKYGGMYNVECGICIEDPAQRQALTDALYSVYWYRDLRTNRPVFRTPLQWIQGLFTHKNNRQYRILDRFATIMTTDGDAGFIIIHDGEDERSFTTYGPLSSGIQALIQHPDGHSEQIQILDEVENSSQQRIGSFPLASRQFKYSIRTLSEQ